MAKDRRSRDQKRRDKKKEKAANSQPAKTSLAYFGSKYKTEKLIPVWFKTELGIYEAFVVMDHKLLDQTVADALEMLIKRIRAKGLPAMETVTELPFEEGQEVEFVIGRICWNWAIYFAESPVLPNEKLIGILKSLLGTLEDQRTPGPRSQSYLRYIGDFITKKAKVSVKKETIVPKLHSDTEGKE